jgi:hypothetical protein
MVYANLDECGRNLRLYRSGRCGRCGRCGCKPPSLPASERVVDLDSADARLAFPCVGDLDADLAQEKSPPAVACPIAPAGRPARSWTWRRAHPKKGVTRPWRGML